MDLPRNVTQIGESDRHCKIYVEDYVISYMKQLNALAADKEMAVALYGIRKEENELTYLFLYGACKLNFLQRESRHLSQAQLQEIERDRRKYFKEYSFLAYRMLNGEMIEGFHVYEQGICRYIAGYSRFYEKNDSMLSYMLEVREEAQPEKVEQDIYDEVKKRQDARKTAHEEQTSKHLLQEREKKKAGGWGSAAAVLALLMIIGVASVDRAGGWKTVYTSVSRTWEEIMRQKLPDAMETAEETVQVDAIIAEDKLAEAVMREQTQEMEQEQSPDQQPLTSEQQPAPEQPTNSEQPTDPEQQSLSEQQEETLPADAEVTLETNGPEYYTICAGDTLTGICLQTYGTDARLAEICILNQITDPDDIKVGQKILLP